MGYIICYTRWAVGVNLIKTRTCEHSGRMRTLSSYGSIFCKKKMLNIPWYTSCKLHGQYYVFLLLIILLCLQINLIASFSMHLLCHMALDRIMAAISLCPYMYVYMYAYSTRQLVILTCTCTVSISFIIRSVWVSFGRRVRHWPVCVFGCTSAVGVCSYRVCYTQTFYCYSVPRTCTSTSSG